MGKGLERFDSQDWVFVPMKDPRGGARIHKNRKVKGKLLTEFEKAYILNNYKNFKDREIAEKLGRARVTICNFRNAQGISKPVGGYKKGHTPVNKGKKMPDGWGRGRGFKHGHIPHNVKRLGEIAKNTHGKFAYLFIKLESGEWERFHRYVWEQANGPIPKGYSIQFKDKNTLNCEPSNLYLISRHDHLIQNDIKRYGPELQKLIRLSGKLKRKIRHHEKQD